MVALAFIHTQVFLSSVNSAFIPILAQLETLFTPTSLGVTWCPAYPPARTALLPKYPEDPPGSGFPNYFSCETESTSPSNRMNLKLKASTLLAINTILAFKTPEASRNYAITAALTPRNPPADGSRSRTAPVAPGRRGSVQASGKFVA